MVAAVLLLVLSCLFCGATLTLSPFVGNSPQNPRYAVIPLYDPTNLFYSASWNGGIQLLKISTNGIILGYQPWRGGGAIRLG